LPGHEGSFVIGRSPLFGVSVKREFNVTIKLDVPVAAYKIYCIAVICAGSRTDIHSSEAHYQNRVLWRSIGKWLPPTCDYRVLPTGYNSNHDAKYPL